jgi:hypothetical protein
MAAGGESDWLSASVSIAHEALAPLASTPSQHALLRSLAQLSARNSLLSDSRCRHRRNAVSERSTTFENFL